jgi:protein-tyrosine-phosphatase
MAEGIMKNLLPVELRNNMPVGSAGTVAIDGSPPSQLSFITCMVNGIDILGHKARLLTRGTVENSDIILTMERSHREVVEKLGGGRKVSLVTGYPEDTGDLSEIMDPLGKDLEAYEALFDDLEREISRIVTYLTTKDD